MRHCLVDLYKSCSNYSPRFKLDPARAVIGFLIYTYSENIKKSSPKPQGLELRYLA